MHPNFVLMTLPNQPGPGNASGLEFVEILPFTPLNRNNLIGWIAARSDGAHYGNRRGLRLPEDAPGRRAAADRGAHRPERAALRPAHALESAGLARHPRQPSGDSLRAGALVRGADLSAGAEQPHAGVAAGCACAPGPAGLRADLRGGAELAVRIGDSIADGCGGAASGGSGRARRRAKAGNGCECAHRSRRAGTLPTTSSSLRRASWPKRGKSSTT